MKDIKISTIRLNARGELSFKLLVKPGDFTEVEKQLLINAELNGDYLDMNITGLVNGDTDKVRKEKLVKLNGLMSLYCERTVRDINCEKDRLYERNKIKSRRELTDSQLDSEIETYKAGLMEYS